MLHGEDMTEMLSFLAERVKGIQTAEEEALASLLVRAVVEGDRVRIYLLGERGYFSFRYVYGKWIPDSDFEKENTLARGEQRRL